MWLEMRSSADGDLLLSMTAERVEYATERLRQRAERWLSNGFLAWDGTGITPMPTVRVTPADPQFLQRLRQYLRSQFSFVVHVLENPSPPDRRWACAECGSAMHRHCGHCGGVKRIPVVTPLTIPEATTIDGPLGVVSFAIERERPPDPGQEIDGRTATIWYATPDAVMDDDGVVQAKRVDWDPLLVVRRL